MSGSVKWEKSQSMHFSVMFLVCSSIECRRSIDAFENLDHGKNGTHLELRKEKYISKSKHK